MLISRTELSYYATVIHPRGRNDPNWRKGTWLLRGETMDDKINVTHPFKGVQAVSTAYYYQKCIKLNYSMLSRSRGLHAPMAKMGMNL